MQKILDYSPKKTYILRLNLKLYVLRRALRMFGKN